MATEKVIYEADTARLLGALDKVINKEVQLRQGLKQTKTEAKDAGGTFAGLGDKAVAALSGMAAGALGVHKIIGMLRAETQETATALAELVRQSKGLEAASIAVANQMNIASTVAGQQVGKDVLGRIMAAGRFADPETAKAIAIAGHVSFGRPGQPLAGEGMSMTERIAAYAGYKGLAGEEAGGLAKVLYQSGAKNQTDVTRRLAQIQAAYEASLTTDPAANVMGASKFVADYMAQGGGFEQGLAEYMRAINVSGTEEEAANLVRKTTQMLRRDDTMVSLGKYRWPELRRAKDERVVDRFMTLSMDERKQLFGEYISTRSEAEWSRMGLQPRQVGWAAKMYSPEGQAYITEQRQRLEGITGENVPAELAAWGETPAAITRGVRAGTAVMPMEAPDTTRRGEALLEDARMLNRLQRAGARENTIGGRTWITLEQEAYVVAATEMSWRLSRMARGEAGMEKMSADDRRYMAALIAKKLGAPAYGSPGPGQMDFPWIGEFDPYTTTALGEVDIEMRRLEGKYRGGATQVITGTQINNYHGANDMATVGQERPGGENTF